MIKQSKHIEIVCSNGPGLSSMSPPSRQAIAEVLRKHFTHVRITVVETMADLLALVERAPDLVFVGMKFLPVHPHLGSLDPDKIWLTQFLDEHEIAYTGSGQFAHELELNKHLAKQRIVEAGFNTAAFRVAPQHTPFLVENITLTYPLFVKPANRGGGLGIDDDSLVYTPEALHAKVQSISTEVQSDSLIEEYLPGREFSVAILRHPMLDRFSLMPLELIAPANSDGARILSEAVKAADTERFVKVADKVIKEKITSLALNVFQALGARDYGRIDIRMDAAGIPHFLEANLLPSLLNNYGNFPKACQLNMNLDYEHMLLCIVRLGLTRSAEVAEPLILNTTFGLEPTLA